MVRRLKKYYNKKWMDMGAFLMARYLNRRSNAQRKARFLGSFNYKNQRVLPAIPRRSYNRMPQWKLNKKMITLDAYYGRNRPNNNIQMDDPAMSQNNNNTSSYSPPRVRKRSAYRVGTLWEEAMELAARLGTNIDFSRYQHIDRNSAGGFTLSNGDNEIRNIYPPSLLDDDNNV